MIPDIIIGLALGWFSHITFCVVTSPAFRPTHKIVWYLAHSGALVLCIQGASNVTMYTYLILIVALCIKTYVQVINVIKANM